MNDDIDTHGMRFGDLPYEAKLANVAHNNLLLAQENAKQARRNGLASLINVGFAIINFLFALINIRILGNHH